MHRFIKGLILALSIVPTVVMAQPFATGLRAPMELAFTNAGNLLVAEAGSGPNSSRISIVDRRTGTRRTLIDALPSGIHAATNNTSGASGLALQGNSLFVVIGNGDSVMPGPLPGSEVPNPAPSSPILSSVLELRSSKQLDAIGGNFTLARTQHEVLKSGTAVVLTNTAGEELTVRLVVDFPDFSPEPRPDVPNNVRLSNPFGVAVVGQTLYVVDASLNLIRRVDARTGVYSTLTTFSSFPNPTSVGPRFVEAVPDSIRVRGNDLIVTTLTGFPFLEGKAEVRRVALDGSSNTTLVSGLTSAIDVVPLGMTPSSPMLVLEFSTNQLARAPGRLRFVSPGAEPVTIAEGLITPTGVAVHQEGGEIFITHLGPGTITRLTSALVPQPMADAFIPIVGSVNGVNGSQFRTSAQITNPFPYPITGGFVFYPDGFFLVPYNLAAHETKYYDDFTSFLGETNIIGAVDIYPDGQALPQVLVVITDRSAGATAAVSVPVTTAASILTPGLHGTVIVPPDLTTRLNIGLRTFDTASSLLITERNAAGTVVGTATVELPPFHFAQQSVASLLGRIPGANHTLTFAVQSGSVLVYGASTDNNGRAMILQIATPVSEN